MEKKFFQAGLVAQFKCVGSACEDDCCHSWHIQMDDMIIRKYKEESPELLKHIIKEEHGHAMQVRPDNGACCQLENGLCNIHLQKGTDFLSDACHFYPRITRSLGDIIVMNATLSCPEIARLALTEKEAFKQIEMLLPDRVPLSIKNYLPEGLTAHSAQDIILLFNRLFNNPNYSTEENILRLLSIARALDAISPADWKTAIPVYADMAESLLPQAEPNPIDKINLLHALAGIAIATRAQFKPRLHKIIQTISSVLQINLNWETGSISTPKSSLTSIQLVQQAWDDTYKKLYEDTFSKWLLAQISASFFPFINLTQKTIYEQAVLIAGQFATVKLAFACISYAEGKELSIAEQITIIQSIARCYEHLANPRFILDIYESAGWIRESRLRALIEDKQEHIIPA